jgi:hypothetical protein
MAKAVVAIVTMGSQSKGSFRYRWVARTPAPVHTGKLSNSRNECQAGAALDAGREEGGVVECDEEGGSKHPELDGKRSDSDM